MSKVGLRHHIVSTPRSRFCPNCTPGLVPSRSRLASRSLGKWLSGIRESSVVASAFVGNR